MGNWADIAAHTAEKARVAESLPRQQLQLQKLQVVPVRGREDEVVYGRQTCIRGLVYGRTRSRRDDEPVSARGFVYGRTRLRTDDESVSVRGLIFRRTRLCTDDESVSVRGLVCGRTRSHRRQIRFHVLAASVLAGYVLEGYVLTAHLAAKILSPFRSAFGIGRAF